MKTWLLCGIATAACSNVPNSMVGRARSPQALGAPHESILVQTPGGAFQVWLDTGERKLVTAATDATLTRSGVAIYRKDDRYVVERDGEVRTVADVRAAQPWVLLSPDETRFAVMEPADHERNAQAYVTVVALADLSYRRIPVPSTGTLMKWRTRGDALWFEDERRRFYVDPAAGTVSEAPPGPEHTSSTPVPDPAICESRGLRLVRVDTRNRQEIWLEPVATRADPDRVASTTRRLLVSATHHADHGTTHVRMRDPGELGSPMFTRSCDHFVFTLDDAVYVGDVATGSYAWLIVGHMPVFAEPDARGKASW